MNIYLILGIIFLILQTTIFSFLVVSMIRNKKIVSKNNIKYIIPIFILMYLLYVTATIYINNSNGEELFKTDIFYYLSLIGTTLEVFVFKLDIDLIRPIILAYNIFTIDFVLVAILAYITTILSVISLIKNRLFNYFKKRSAFKKNYDIVLGSSESSIEYAKTNKQCIIWDEKLTNDEYESLLKKFIVCKDKLSEKALSKNLKSGAHHLILFKDSKYNYTDIINIFEKTIKIKNNHPSILFLNIESSIEETTALNEKYLANIDKDSNSFVTCFNKYELISRDFIKNYPITKYIPRNFFNDNFSLKNDKNINVVFLGFSDVSLELFKMMSMQFQFAKQSTKENLEVAQVNYFVYDSDKSRLNNEYFLKIDANLNNLYKNNDLPPIEKICNLKRKHADIYSSELYGEIEELVNDENNFTYLIVSLSNDFDNIAYAENLNINLSNKKGYKIFARVKQEHLYVQNLNYEITYFGNENNLLTHNNIANEDLIKLSQYINLEYSGISSQNDKEKLKWHKRPLVEKYSNLYQALNIFFKLNLLGFNVVKSEDVYDKTHIVSKKEFYKTYKPTEFSSLEYEDYFKTNVYNVIGFIEHSRWVAFYYMSGYRCMNFKHFEPTANREKQPHKEHGIKKLHACLTSNQGLDKFIKTCYLMKKYKENYKKYKVTTEDIKTKEFKKLLEYYYYDFMVLNIIYDTLSEMGFVFVKN